VPPEQEHVAVQQLFERVALRLRVEVRLSPAAALDLAESARVLTTPSSVTNVETHKFPHDYRQPRCVIWCHTITDHSTDQKGQDR
jgi:hypothetical protein